MWDVDAGTKCRTTPQQLSDVAEPRTIPAWLTALGDRVGSRWVEHYSVTTDEQFGELIAIVVSVRHRHAHEQWFLRRVVVVSDQRRDQPTVHWFPCYDVVMSRVTLRTGDGSRYLLIYLIV